jgi:pyruvate kinase
MNVARLNFSHGTHEEHLQHINTLKEARRILHQPLAIMLDTKGPEIRIGKIRKEGIALHAHQLLLLTAETLEGNEQRVSITPSFILKNLSVGTLILFDNGYIASRVVRVDERGVLVELENSGILTSGKGVNIPNVDLQLPAVTEKDISDIRFGCQNDVDLIAASFVRSVDHVLAIKNLLIEEKKPDILVIAKIENSEGVRNIDSIVQIADGIMIARGDLGVEVPISEIPRLQKTIIRKSYLAGKPSVTATQMLESMIYNPRPTRAEVSDVANAIYDSTSAVMLSGETAIGKYPNEVVHVMKSIIQESENHFEYDEFFNLHARYTRYHDVPSAVTLATVKTAYSSNAKAIFAFTNSGSTASLLSRMRPAIPIIAMTASEKCYHQMALYWGVVPYLAGGCNTVLEAFDKISLFALQAGFVDKGDLVVVTAGSPFGISGTTNMMIVESIGEVLVRGQYGFGKSVYGNVSIAMSPEMPVYKLRGHLLVITQCDESYLPLIRESSGVILQNIVNDTASENYLLDVAKSLNKPVLIRADAASRTLKDGMLVTLDPAKSIVYKGVVI